MKKKLFDALLFYEELAQGKPWSSFAKKLNSNSFLTHFEIELNEEMKKCLT